ncbi:MAG: IS1 family transposase [Burkholderiaceae bacterium]|nr:IS1 family transposase [Burkholderiaceae bacterium]
MAPSCGLKTYQIVAWALGGRGTTTARVLQSQLPDGAHIQFCTDHHRPDLTILQQRQHEVGKARTHHIESMKNKLRCDLARLRRKTHSDSKSAKALMDSLLFVEGASLGPGNNPKRAA